METKENTESEIALKNISKNAIEEMIFGPSLLRNLSHYNGKPINKTEALNLYVEALKANTSLKVIKFYLSSDLSTSTLLLALKTHPTLYSIECHDIESTDYSRASLTAAALTEILKETTVIRSIKIEDCEFGPKDTFNLAQALKLNTTLRSLELLRCTETAGAMDLADALKANKGLQHIAITHIAMNESLLFSDTTIGDKIAKAFAEVFETNTTLQSLDLRFNKIGDAGVEAFSVVLKTNATLHSLNLGNNKFSSIGVTFLALALINNKTLRSLDLSMAGRNGNSGVQELSKSLKINRSLLSLNLSGNGIGDTGADALALALEANSMLQSLDLSCNNITDQGAIYFGETLKVNRSLTTLNLNSNKIGLEGADALHQALERNFTIMQLDYGVLSKSENFEGGYLYRNQKAAAERPAMVAFLWALKALAPKDTKPELTDSIKPNPTISIKPGFETCSLRTLSEGPYFSPELRFQILEYVAPLLKPLNIRDAIEDREQSKTSKSAKDTAVESKDPATDTSSWDDLGSASGTRKPGAPKPKGRIVFE